MENKIIELINQELAVDITQECRKREIIEARALYFYIIKKLYPKMSLQRIANPLNKNHATVIHSLKNYTYYEKYNPKLEDIKNNILHLVGESQEPVDLTKMQTIDLKKRIFDLENSLEEERNRPRYEYTIVEQLENLLIDTKGTEQHELITLRLEAFYSMNKNIRL
jgi:hypothetical protein